MRRIGFISWSRPPHLSPLPLEGGEGRSEGESYQTGSKTSGLTLIELVTVAALIVILAGLATTRFVESFQARRMDHFVKELVIFLRYVQFKTIEEGTIHKLEIESDSGGIRGFSQDEKPSKFREIRTPFFNRFRNPKPFSIGLDQGDEVYFFPDGRISSNMFLIKSDSQEQASIAVKNRLGVFEVAFHE
ncbi:MAG: hypothetical protein HY584_01370 [Candidatus Omnitrophica bacterium]|nr:hypothetical protein [Candidatus Omnitrophota bacterium]